MAMWLQARPYVGSPQASPPSSHQANSRKHAFSITLALDLTLSEKGVVASTTSTVCIRIAGLISGKSDRPISSCDNWRATAQPPNRVCWLTTLVTSWARWQCPEGGRPGRDQPAREADQDRRGGRQSRALRLVPDGRGRGAATDVCGHSVVDRPATRATCAGTSGGAVKCCKRQGGGMTQSRQRGVSPRRGAINRPLRSPFAGAWHDLPLPGSFNGAILGSKPPGSGECRLGGGKDDNHIPMDLGYGKAMCHGSMLCSYRWCQGVVCTARRSAI